MPLGSGHIDQHSWKLRNISGGTKCSYLCNWMKPQIPISYNKTTEAQIPCWHVDTFFHLKWKDKGREIGTIPPSPSGYSCFPEKPHLINPACKPSCQEHNNWVVLWVINRAWLSQERHRPEEPLATGLFGWRPGCYYFMSKGSPNFLQILRELKQDRNNNNNLWTKKNWVYGKEKMEYI